MKKLASFLFVFAFHFSYSQYYYKDLVAAADIMRLMKSYSTNNIRKATAAGMTPQGMVSAEFNEVHEVSPDGFTLKITTRINQTFSKLVYTFNIHNQLSGVLDSSSGILSRSTYLYDSSGKIVSISNIISDPDTIHNFSQSEIHIYQYKNDKPQKMWRIINKTDSLEVRFTTDENGNIIEERNFRRNTGSDPIYYYYDDQNRLTDIVRYNYKAKRLLPDYLFEYDDSNRVIQKITTGSSQHLGYLIWRYLYNEKGLKTKEALFNKEKQLQGRIDYSYN